MLTKNQEVEIEAIINALGYLEGNRYQKEPDCEESVKELIRFLRRDSPVDCAVRRKLCRSGIVGTDLVHILQNYPDHRDLFDVTLRLLLNLSQPAVLCFNGGKIPTDRTTLIHYRDLIQWQRHSKSAFANFEFMAVLTRKMKIFLEKPWEEQDEDERLTAERIILLIRNGLHLMNPLSDDQKGGNCPTAHDQIISCVSDSGMLEMLLFIGKSNGHSNWHLFLLEILRLLFKEHENPKIICAAGRDRTDEEKEAEKRKLSQILNSDSVKKPRTASNLTSRHSRFAGSYQIRGLKAICPENDAIAHRVVNDPNRVEWLQERKKGKRVAKNRVPVVSAKKRNVSLPTIHAALKKFCVDFLETCYNPLIKSARYLINRNRDRVATSRGQQDDSYFLWAVRFFLEFCRTEKLSLSTVKESLNYQSFHYVQTQLENYLEMAESDKNEAKEWGERAGLAIQTYKELLLSFQEMTRRPKWKEDVDQIEKYIFYQTEYRELCITLLKRYQPTYLSKIYLVDLIESSHLYLRFLEKYCQTRGAEFKIMKKKKKPKQRKKTVAKKDEGTKSESGGTPEPSAEELEIKWEGLSEELCSLLQGHGEIPKEVVPFDATMDVEDDVHMKVAAGRIQRALREERLAEAVGLYRSSRELWPTTDLFGTAEAEPEEEFLQLKDYFTTEMENLEKPPALAPAEDEGTEGMEGEVEEPGEEDELEDEEVAAEQNEYITREVDFSFNDFLGRLARHDILKWYIWIFKDFASNPPELNHAVIKLLHRVAFDLGLTPLLFQASLFRIFQAIGSHRGYLGKKEELYGFSRRLLREFFKLAQDNRKLFVELLFWKNSKAAFEIQYGYGSSQEQMKKPAWTEDLELEVRERYEEYQAMEEKPEGVSLLEFVTHSLSVQKTEKQIKRHLKEMGLEVPKTKAKKSGKRRPINLENIDGLLEAIEQDLTENKDTQKISDIPKPKKLKKKKKKLNQFSSHWNHLGSDVSAGESSEVTSDSSDDDGAKSNNENSGDEIAKPTSNRTRKVKTGSALDLSDSEEGERLDQIDPTTNPLSVLSDSDNEKGDSANKFGKALTKIRKPGRLALSDSDDEKQNNDHHNDHRTGSKDMDHLIPPESGSSAQDPDEDIPTFESILASKSSQHRKISPTSPRNLKLTKSKEAKHFLADSDDEPESVRARPKRINLESDEDEGNEEREPVGSVVQPSPLKPSQTSNVIKRKRIISDSD